TAGFIAYIILPIHYWLAQRGIRSSLAYVLILLAFFGVCAVLGVAIQSSFQDLNEKLPSYKANFTGFVDRLSQEFPGIEENVIDPLLHRDPSAVDRGVERVRAALDTLLSFLSQAFVVLVYLIFILAEQAGLKPRIERAFGAERTPYVFGVISQINTSIA